MIYTDAQLLKMLRAWWSRDPAMLGGLMWSGKANVADAVAVAQAAGIANAHELMTEFLAEHGQDATWRELIQGWPETALRSTPVTAIETPVSEEFEVTAVRAGTGWNTAITLAQHQDGTQSAWVTLSVPIEHPLASLHTGRKVTISA